MHILNNLIIYRTSRMDFLIYLLQLSHNQYFHILGTSKSFTASPTPSIEETQETVMIEIRHLNITAVLFELSLFCTISFEQKGVIEGF